MKTPNKIYSTAIITPYTKLLLGKDVTIGDYVFIHQKELLLGDGSQINAHASITGGGLTRIGRNCVVSYGVRLITGSDSPRGLFMNDASPEDLRHITRGSITLEDNVFIGANAVCCITPKRPDIRIGEGSVVGALSYIDSSIGAWKIVTPPKTFNIRDRISSIGDRDGANGRTGHNSHPKTRVT